MIIKIKTKEIVDGIELVSSDKKGTCYRVTPENLTEVIKNIYKQTGISKFKIVIENSKEILYNEDRTRNVKKSQQELLEIIVGEKVKILTEEKDVKKFFKAIGFCDEGDIAYELYKGIAECTEEEIANHRNIYQYVWRKVFHNARDKEQSLEYSMLLTSIKKWWSTTEYTDMYKNLQYNQFIKFLLRNTGFKY